MKEVQRTIGCRNRRWAKRERAVHAQQAHERKLGKNWLAVNNRRHEVNPKARPKLKKELAAIAPGLSPAIDELR